MTITKINATTFMVEMAKEEIPTTSKRELAYHILSMALSDVTIDTKNCAFLLEGVETVKGEVFLLTIKAMPKRYKIKKKGDCAVYSFNSLDDFTGCITALYRQNSPLPDNSTYIMNDLYYLVFRNSVIGKSAKVTLSEYGRVIKKGHRMKGILQEYGFVLTERNSVEFIGSSFTCKEP